MSTPNEDDATMDAATAITNVEPSSTTSATSSLFPAAVVAISQDPRRDNAESLAAATARGNVEIIEDEDSPSVLPSFYSEWDGSGWPDSTAGWNLEIIEDKDGPRVPPSFSDQFDSEWEHFGKKAKARLEIIPDHTGPSLPPAMMEYADSKKMEPVLVTSPCPFNVADIEDEKDALEKGRPPRRQIVREDSLAIPPNEYMEDNDLRIHTDRRGGRAEDYIVNANVAPSNDGERGDEDEEANVRNGNPEDALARPDLERDSTFRVPEAVLVEESINEVYMGEPIEPPLPWWKQRRTRILLSLMFVFVAISAIIIGSLLSAENTTAEPVAMVFTITNAPSISAFPSKAPSTSRFPSATPTGAPSVSVKPTSSPSDDPSPMPSSPPSACVAKIASNRQKIDLLIDDPQRPEVAVDGKNAVVVVQGGPREEGNPAYVTFHSLEAIVGWMSVDIFLIDDLGNQDWYSVALSGKTAFIGFPYANDYVGAVLVFEQNQFGSWQKVEDPFVHVSAASHYLFGLSVSIDGDLAFVGGKSNVYMFRRGNNGKWVEFDMVDGMFGKSSDHSNSISGDIIAVPNFLEIQLYKYMPDLDIVLPLPIQDPIRTGYFWSMSLSKDYLAYWDADAEDVFVYRKEETNQTFAFHQQLNISGPEINSLAMDSDILVVGGINSTHIFSEQDGNWEETITLDKRYDYYALSGRQLLAATSTEVHAFDIQDCAQEMPTQTPSSSQMPSSNPTTLPSTSASPPPSIAPSSSVSPSTSPSSPPSIAPSSSVSPSTSPSTSMAPSSSTSPTSCYWLTIAIDYDEKPEETYWGLWRGVDGWEELKRHYASEGDTSYSESICLEEGEYSFDIYDYGDARDGICCDDGEVSYNVTVDGTLIVEGGEFGSLEETYFSLPFVAGTNETTQYD